MLKHQPTDLRTFITEQMSSLFGMLLHVWHILCPILPSYREHSTGMKLGERCNCLGNVHCSNSMVHVLTNRRMQARAAPKWNADQGSGVLNVLDVTYNNREKARMP